MTDMEIVARAIMIAKGGACDVTDWAEREWNPAVAEAWDAAVAALAAATPLIEARVQEECAQVADGFDAPHLAGVGKRIFAAIRKGRP